MMIIVSYMVYISSHPEDLGILLFVGFAVLYLEEIIKENS